MEFQFKEHYSLDDLRTIIKILRSPEGCPWDRKQNHHSIRNDFIEETYEAVEALDTDNRELLCEELGDVLFQVLFHCQLEEETGGFSFEDIADGAAKKMIVRHPHVFGTVKVNGEGDVLKNWDDIKQKTKHRESYTEALQGVSPALPALMRAAKVQEKAESYGCPIEQQPAAVKPEQAGKVLFEAVRAVRAAGLEPEEVLSAETDRYIKKFADWEKLNSVAVSESKKEKKAK